MFFFDKDTQFVSKILEESHKKSPIEIAWKIYEKEDKQRAISIIREYKIYKEIYKESDKKQDIDVICGDKIYAQKFINLCIKSNDFETIQLLSQLVPNLFNDRVSGISTAIVLGNKEILQRFIESGAKPDTLSKEEVKKLNSDLAKHLSSINYKWLIHIDLDFMNKGFSAFYLAVISDNLDMAKMLAEKFPDKVKLIRKTVDSNTCTTVYEDLWESVVKTGKTQTAQWLFDHPLFKEQFFERLELQFYRSIETQFNFIFDEFFFESLEALTNDQRQQIWKYIETNKNSYTGDISLAEFCWKKAGTSRLHSDDLTFRTKLMETYPEKYSEYFEKYTKSVNKKERNEWVYAINKSTLDVVKTFVKKRPSLLKKTWENNRIGGQTGPLAEAFFNAKDRSIVEWLSMRPGVMKAEAAKIQECIMTNCWYKATNFDQPEAEDEIKQKKMYSEFERLMLMKHVSLNNKRKTPQQPQHAMTNVL